MGSSVKRNKTFTCYKVSLYKLLISDHGKNKNFTQESCTVHNHNQWWKLALLILG